MRGVTWHEVAAWLTGFVKDWAVVVLLGTLALLGVAKIGEDVFEHESTRFDEAVQGWMLAHHNPTAERVFQWITIVGGITGMCVLTVAGGAYLWFRGRRHVAAAVLAVPVIAIALFNVVKTVYARPRPLGLGGRVDTDFSFPSGHSTASAAVCCTLAYVFWREGFVGRRAAIAFAVVVPLLIGGSRLYLNVHWATDVLGGWCVGLLIAALTAALYVRHRQQRAAHRPNVPSPTTSTSRS